ncbi:unnamed protein product [Protopolystoma xenopodis]|uniref:Uncharacterized protein n=1 Tax=Protopolystoma xenopodis TaxID=117903 RepID=A0A448XCZ8_9PLAT|nr:unnamed protein product [Protopolystoma xenopodis]
MFRPDRGSQIPEYSSHTTSVLSHQQSPVSTISSFSHPAEMPDDNINLVISIDHPAPDYNSLAGKYTFPYANLASSGYPSATSRQPTHDPTGSANQRTGLWVTGPADWLFPSTNPTSGRVDQSDSHRQDTTHYSQRNDTSRRQSHHLSRAPMVDVGLPRPSVGRLLSSTCPPDAYAFMSSAPVDNTSINAMTTRPSLRDCHADHLINVPSESGAAGLESAGGLSLRHSAYSPSGMAGSYAAQWAAGGAVPGQRLTTGPLVRAQLVESPEVNEVEESERSGRWKPLQTGLPTTLPSKQPVPWTSTSLSSSSRGESVRLPSLRYPYTMNATAVSNEPCQPQVTSTTSSASSVAAKLSPFYSANCGQHSNSAQVSSVNEARNSCGLGEPGKLTSLRGLYWNSANSARGKDNSGSGGDANNCRGTIVNASNPSNSSGMAAHPLTGMHAPSAFSTVQATPLPVFSASYERGQTAARIYSLGVPIEPSASNPAAKGRASSSGRQPIRVEDVSGGAIKA